MRADEARQPSRRTGKGALDGVELGRRPRLPSGFRRVAHLRDAARERVHRLGDRGEFRVVDRHVPILTDLTGRADRSFATLGDVLKTLDLRGTSPEVPADLPRPDQAGDEPVAVVRAILADGRARGDEALRELTRRFDGIEIGELRVPVSEIRRRPRPGRRRARRVAPSPRQGRSRPSTGTVSPSREPSSTTAIEISRAACSPSTGSASTCRAAGRPTPRAC